MSDKSLFRRNLLIIVALHVLVVCGLFFSGFFSRHRDDATWLDGGGSPPQQASQAGNAQPAPDETAPDSTPDKSPADSGSSAPSLIFLGTPAPSATPTPTPTPTPRRTPEPSTPTPTPTPRTPTPAPSTPRRTPTPKKSASRSPSPKTTPKKSSTPEASSSAKKSASHSETPKPKSTAGKGNDDHEDTGAANAGTSSPKGGKPGTRPGEGGGNRGGKGSIGGAERESQIRWYLEKIHDRIYSRWVSPSADPTLSVLIKIRIQKDGHVSDVSLAKSSGNPAMDESAMLAAKSVKQLDPLPSVIDDSFYDVPIEFKPTPQ